MDALDTEYYDYHLPNDKIAIEPKSNRANSKMMYVESSNLHHMNFNQLNNILESGDLLILNNTRVIPARLLLEKESGGKIEILYYQDINQNQFEVIFKSSRRPLNGSILQYKKKYFFKVIDSKENKLVLDNLCDENIRKILEVCGEMPLPKYIKRPVNEKDKEMYQTVYAKVSGSVAAPTAGLHFTKDLIDRLIKKGVIIDYCTLDISYNTFKPIKTNLINDHNIGSEKFSISRSVLDRVIETKKNSKRVVAVGTTVTRVLEYCFTKNITNDYQGEVDLYITPGYKFKAINGLITNFHLPKSTLLLLVSSFINHDHLMALYKSAIDNDYKFYSYGDSMFIDKKL